MRRLVTTLPDGLVAPSCSTLASVGPAAGRLPTAIFGFPVPLLTAAPAAVRPDVRCVGIVGRLVQWKGQHIFARLCPRFPDGDVRARVVGSAVFSEMKYEADLHALAERLGIADRVEFRASARTSTRSSRSWTCWCTPRSCRIRFPPSCLGVWRPAC